MLRLDLGVVRRPGQLLGADDSLAGFFSEFVDVHRAASSFLSASKISRCSGVKCFGSSASTVT